MNRRPGTPGADRGGAPWVRAKQQRWEAVFRRERRPVSLDRSSIRAQSRPYLALQGENAVGTPFSPCHFPNQRSFLL